MAMTLQPVAGTDVGTIGTVVNYASNADYAASYQKLMADEEFQAFWLRASAEGAATPAETSLYNDVDPDYQPNVDRPLGAMMATQWRAKDGRLADFMGKVIESVPHIERMGGTPRVMQSVIGALPMTVSIAVTFADLDAYGAYADTIAGDDQWQAFWAGAMADPTADMVRAGVYLIEQG